jgi:hypothetical protein
MLASTATSSAVELYEKLTAAFPVEPVYRVSFNKSLSQDVLDIILHLKKDLQPQDIVPNFPTSLTLTVQLPGGIQKAFHQDSNTYMQAFDVENYRNFVEECLQFIPEIQN